MNQRMSNWEMKTGKVIFLLLFLHIYIFAVIPVQKAFEQANIYNKTLVIKEEIHDSKPIFSCVMTENNEKYEKEHQLEKKIQQLERDAEEQKKITTQLKDDHKSTRLQMTAILEKIEMMNQIIQDNERTIQMLSFHGKSCTL